MTRAPFDLHLRLLRKGMAQRAAQRDTCSVCHRTPLVGERVARHADGAMTCPLCVDRRPAGEIERVELVHHSEWGHAVKPLARIPRAA